MLPFDRNKLLPAVVVTLCLFLAGVILLLAGCAYRNVPGPGGTTVKAPATAFENILVYNVMLAQANTGIADNVIAFQHAGFMGIPEAKAILLKQGEIAQADIRLTERLRAAANCGHDAAGPQPTASQLDAATVTCAKISGAGIAADVTLVLGAISDLNQAALLGVKDPIKKQMLKDLIATVENLIGQISAALLKQGVIAAPATKTEVKP